MTHVQRERFSVTEVTSDRLPDMPNRVIYLVDTDEGERLFFKWNPDSEWWVRLPDGPYTTVDREQVMDVPLYDTFDEEWGLDDLEGALAEAREQS